MSIEDTKFADELNDHGRRTEERLALEIPLDLVYGKTKAQLRTGDVSYKGVFVCTQDPPPLYELLRVDVVLPGEDVTLTLHAVATHLVEAEDESGHPAGVGLQFYGIGNSDRESWVRIVKRFQKTAEDVLELPYDSYMISPG